MAGLRPPRPAEPGAVGEPPRCLRFRGASAVWGTRPGDPLAPARWRTAASRWRTAATDSGMSSAEVWAALPGGAHRFGADDRVELTLRHYGWSEADLPAIAREARATFPEMFDPAWGPEVAVAGYSDPAALARLVGQRP